MKLYATIGKIVAAIAAIAGIAFLVVKYMDAIKAWLGKLCPCCADVDLEDDFVDEDEIPEEPAEDAAEDAPAADEAAADEADPVAEETDFEA